VLAARSIQSLDAVVAECAALGAEAVAVPADVRSDEQLATVVAVAVARFERIDVWVGAASVFAYGTFEQLPAEIFHELIEVNLFGQARGARAVLPRLRAQGGGTIIFLGSVYSRTATPYVSAYITSKHALLGMAESLRQEVEPDGIDVCTILPVTVDTPIYQHAANHLGHRVKPLPPLIAPERVARAIVRTADHPRPWRYVGWLQRFAIPVHRWAPRLAGRLSLWILDRVSLQPEPAPPTAGTLYEPQPESNAVDGGWRKR
jgi:short-subunit dehydrogenase